MDTVQWLAINIFGTPAILIALIVLLGTLLQKKELSDVIKSTIKAAIGFIIIQAGAEIIVKAVVVFQPIWTEVFNLSEENLGNFIGQENFLNQYGSAIALSMTLGFCLNILLAIITKFKYIYLTGHMMFWMTTIMAGIVVNTVQDISIGKLVIFLSIVMGLYWTIQPALTQRFMRLVTGNDDIAFGHTSASVAILSAIFGKIFGDPKQSSENIKLPKQMEFLKDSNVINALTMGVLFLVGAIIVSSKGTVSSEQIIANAGQQDFHVYSIIHALTFAGGIAIVIYGVKMFINELLPAFEGIAKKVVPGAKPAIDAAVTFTYAPNAVTLGFIGGFTGSILWMIILGSTGIYVFVPTMIVIFFHSATAGVFGNATGGIRGAVIGGFITSTVVALGQFVTVTFLTQTTIPDMVMWTGDSDMFILGPIVKVLAEIFL